MALVAFLTNVAYPVFLPLSMLCRSWHKKVYYIRRYLLGEHRADYAAGCVVCVSCAARRDRVSKYYLRSGKDERSAH